MDNGMLDKENFSEVMQGLSQRRRGGVLELSRPGQTVSIFFHQGRIIDVAIGDELPVQAVLESLIACGEVPKATATSAKSYRGLYDQIKELPGIGRIGEAEYFDWVVQQLLLDRLYNLDVAPGFSFSFRSRVLDPRDHSLKSVSVGQLLLDLVSFDAVCDRFLKVFTGGIMVQAAKEAVPSFSEDEEIIFAHLAEGTVAVEVLRKKTLLSCFHFEEALLALYDQGFVSLVNSAGAAADDEGLSLEAAASELDLDLEVGESRPGSVSFAAPQAADANLEISVPDEAGFEKSTVVAEEETEVGRLTLRTRLNILNSQLLQGNQLPRLMSLIFMLCAIFAPFLFWRVILRLFAE